MDEDNVGLKTAFDIFNTVQQMDETSLAVWHKAISDELWNRQKKRIEKSILKKLDREEAATR